MGTGVLVFVAVSVLVGVKLFVLVFVLVGVKLWVEVNVAVKVGVKLAVAVLVTVNVRVGVKVAVDVGVKVGVGGWGTIWMACTSALSTLAGPNSMVMVPPEGAILLKISVTALFCPPAVA